MGKTRKIRGGQSSINIVDSAQNCVNNIISIFTSLDKTKIYYLSSNIKTKIDSLVINLNKTINIIRALGVENTDGMYYDPLTATFPVLPTAISMSPNIENIFISKIDSTVYNLNNIIKYLKSISTVPRSDNNIPIVSFQLHCIRDYIFILFMFFSGIPPPKSAPRPSSKPAPKGAPRPAPIDYFRPSPRII